MVQADESEARDTSARVSNNQMDPVAELFEVFRDALEIDDVRLRASAAGLRQLRTHIEVVDAPVARALVIGAEVEAERREAIFR